MIDEAVTQLDADFPEEVMRVKVTWWAVFPFAGGFPFRSNQTAGWLMINIA
jgi:hypothetical protein